MATLDASAILQAVDELLTGALGSVRTVPADTFRHGGSSLDDPDDPRARVTSRQTMVSPRVESRITRVMSKNKRPPRGGDWTLYALNLEVVTTYQFAWADLLKRDSRRAVFAQAASDASLISQALEWPGNMAADSDADPTGLLSGLFTHLGSDIGQPTRIPEETVGLLRATHRFEGTARVETAS